MYTTRMLQEFAYLECVKWVDCVAVYRWGGGVVGFNLRQDVFSVLSCMV